MKYILIIIIFNTIVTAEFNDYDSCTTASRELTGMGSALALCYPKGEEK